MSPSLASLFGAGAGAAPILTGVVALLGLVTGKYFLIFLAAALFFAPFIPNLNLSAPVIMVIVLVIVIVLIGNKK